MSVSTYDLWPKKLVVGPGAVKNVGSEVKAMGKEKVMLFTDQTMKELPMVKELLSQLESEGLKVTLFGEIGPNPTDEMVHSAVEEMKKVQPEVIVCIGGGSPIDCAKAANVVYTHGGTVDMYDIGIGGITRITPKVLPFIAIPTTAGTGSEVTNVGVITDTKRHVKYGVLSPLLVPDIAVLDPELTVSLPANTTAFTGMDALTHAIEAFVSVAGSHIADALAIKSMKMTYNNLKTAVFEGKDIKAREEMIVASMMAGFSFNIKGLGLCHQMAHQLSSYCGLPHGMANAILLPHVMKFNMTACPEKFAEIAEVLGVDIRGLSVQEAADKSVELVAKLSEELNIPKYLDDVGVDKNLVDAMVKTALEDSVGMNNPMKTTAEECRQVYLNAFRP